MRRPEAAPIRNRGPALIDPRLFEEGATNPPHAREFWLEAQLDRRIVGAGFAGMYMLHRLRGLGFSARVFEAGTGIGGIWYRKPLPSARCDIESLDYQCGFAELEREWNWSERSATRSEILR